MRSDLPTGTVTFLFTDVEGSTKLLEELGAERYADALAEHRRVVREAFRRHGGVEVDTQGDAFFYAFPTAPGALESAAEAVARLADGPVRVRVGLHTGTPLLAEEGYVGPDVHRAARIAAAGHGGQVLVSASAAALLGPSYKLSQGGLRDLGEHRLKDLSGPERIYQLGDGEFPPLRTLHQTNLPVPATPFLGRERELGEVLGLLSREDNRLLTLTGPGGSGKTRLALQSAAALAERYPHGVWWVPLAPLRDPQLVLESASSALGAKNGLAEHVADRRLLLLFDNFEHLVGAANGVALLLSSCPNLELLVTSREPLHVTGEQEYPVPPFAHEEAVGFFSARARAIDPAFRPDDAVAEICARLDDLPLALELAAARVKALTSRQIVERLEQRLPLLTAGARDAPERQRTLRATIQWSHDLLSEEEQRLFRRLAVFRGGCTLEAAEAVSDAGLDTLHSLVDKSLLRQREGRYWMLETIREFAVEQLEASGEADEHRRRHADYFLALVEEAELPLRRNRSDWVNRLDEDRDNLRAALDRLAATGQTQEALRLLGAGARYWYLRGLWPEVWRLLESALDADETATPARVKALRQAGAMAVVNQQFATARRRLQEATALREHDDAWGAAHARFLLGFLAVESGDFRAAREPLEESLELYRELGDEHALGITAFNLAWTYDELGDLERGRELSEENLRRAEALGDDRLRFFSLGSLAFYEEQEGRLQAALSLLKEGVRLSQAAGDPVHTAYMLVRVASLLARGGDAEVSAALLARATKVSEDVGVDVPRYLASRRDGTLAVLGQRLPDEVLARRLEAGRGLDLAAAVELALASSVEADGSAERDEAGLVEP